MKTTLKTMTFFTSLLILGAPFYSVANAALCSGPFAQAANSPEISWRQGTTQYLANGEVTPTSATREKTIQSKVAYMENFILNFIGDFTLSNGPGDIPPMQFVPAEGEHVRAISTSSGLGGVITRYVVSGVGAKATVDGTLLLPVSGHNGNANARHWAVTDTYQVRLDTNPNQTPASHHSWGRTGRETVFLRDIKSLDLVTKQEVQIPLKANVPVVVLYDRRYSAGPSGYVEGRVMEFIWDGT